MLEQFFARKMIRFMLAITPASEPATLAHFTSVLEEFSDAEQREYLSRLERTVKALRKVLQ